MKFTSFLKYIVFAGVVLVAAGVKAQTITTVAGGFGDNMDAVRYGRFVSPSSVLSVAGGNIYVADLGYNRMQIIEGATGKTQLLFGNNYYSANAIVRDRNRNLYYSGNSYIIKVDTAGVQSLFCGTGSSGYSGDGSAATAATINGAYGMAIDRNGNIYVVDASNNRVRKIDTNGIINTIAGNGGRATSGDGGSAIAAQLYDPKYVAVDSSGNVFISCTGSNSIRKVNLSGIITTVYSSMSGYLYFDTLGRFYVAQGARVLRLNSSGSFVTIAGTGTTGFSGDGGPATAARIYCYGISLNGAGELILADGGNSRVRKVDGAGNIHTIAGNGIAMTGISGDGDSALLALFSGLNGLEVDNAGNLFFSEGNRIRKIDARTSLLSTVAGIGTAGFSGDGGAATIAQMQNPKGLAFDRAGNLFIADYSNHHVRKVTPSGIISTVAGGGSSGIGDGGPATAAQIYPYAVDLDTAGNLYIADYDNHRIRKVDYSTNIITTVAGGGTSGLGGAATAANIGYPTDVVIDRKGNMYIANGGSNGVKVDGNGIATLSAISGSKLTCDTVGNVYSFYNTTLGTMLDTNGYLHPIMGTGAAGYSGDSGRALNAKVGAVEGITLDNQGQLFFGQSDSYTSSRSSAIRKVCCLTTWVDYPPLFTRGATQSLIICAGTTSVTIDSLFRATDADTGDTIRWKVAVAPAHGTLTGFPYTTLSTGGALSPSGFVYTPTTGYTGTDVFKISIGDGTDTNLTVVNVNISPATVAGTIYGSTYVCLGTPAAHSVYGGTAAGVWYMTNGNATISATGTVTGVAPGTDTILYVVANACGTDTTRMPVTVYNPFSSVTLTGATTICAGTSTSLTPSLSGGTWSISGGVASVSATGVVTGLRGGTVTITYSLYTSCGSATDTQAMNINPAPDAGTISPLTTLCVGNTATLSTSRTGGIWSATNSSATITLGGVITGAHVGTDTIRYIATNSCGSDTAIQIINITPAGTAGTISGPSVVCVGTSATLSSTVSGGSWSTADPYITIGSGSGVVSGVASGIAMVTYSVSSSCGVATDTAIINVNPALSAGTISGPSTLCVGSTGAMSTTGTGGTWSSSNPSIATINSSGMVTGISGGAALLSYSVSSSCGTSVAIALINVNTSSFIGAITGASSVCTGGTTTLSHSTTGGTWSSSTPAIATVSSSGVVYGVASGTAAISYSVSASCGMSVTATNITVNAAPDAGTLSGPVSLCVAATSLVVSSSGGGTWSTSSGTIASVNTTGVVTGISAGTAVFTYIVSNSCGEDTATYSLTIAPVPMSGAISGASSVCAGASITLTTSGTGGVWSSGAASIATVSTSGTVTGLSAGAVTISYTVTNGCGIAAATSTVTVNAASAGTLTGSTTLCPGGTTTLGSTVVGGSWSTSTPTVASISSSGVVTAGTSGTAVISYRVSGSCGSDTSRVLLTVNPLPSIAAIGGTTTLCIGGTSSLTNATTGGTWSSATPGIATISSTGVIIGVAAGTAVISYAVTGTCGASSVTATVTVLGPPSAGSISGASTVCAGSSVILTPSVTGGIWSSGATAIASVNTAGAVTGISRGTTVITYYVTSSCGTDTATHNITVNSSSAGTITGITTLCTGSTTTLSSTDTSGAWSTSTASVASINSSGVVIGTGAGTAVISYTVSGVCGTSVATATVTVGTAPSVAAISGSATLCAGSTATFTDATSGGVWSSGSPSIASISSSGAGHGIAAGVAVISYTVTGACGATSVVSTIHIQTTPTAGSITGASTLCSGTTTPLADTIAGGAWSTATPGIASISASGVVAGVSAGSATISYTVTNSCGSAATTYTVTVTTVPAPGSVTGVTSFCEGSSTVLSATATGGTWSSANPSVASVDGSGVVFGVSAGSAVISYALTNSCGSAYATTTVTVNPLPYIAAISGSTTVPVGATTTLTDAVGGGSWTTSDATIASVSNLGVVTGMTAGSAMITYTMVNVYGCSVDTTFAINVTPPTVVNDLNGNGVYQLFPNPATNKVTLSWSNMSGKDAVVTLTDVTGKVVLKQPFTINAAHGSITLELSNLSAGMYVVKIVGDGGGYYSKLVLE